MTLTLVVCTMTKRPEPITEENLETGRAILDGSLVESWMLERVAEDVTRNRRWITGAIPHHPHQTEPKPKRRRGPASGQKQFFGEDDGTSS